MCRVSDRLDDHDAMASPSRTGKAESKSTAKKQQYNDGSSYRFVLPGSFLMTTLVAVSVFSFGLGKACRFWMASHVMTKSPATEAAYELPQVTYYLNEELPSTTYTAQNFDTSFPATSSSILARKDYSKSTHGGSAKTTLPDNNSNNFHYHYSSGQHILIDIQHVEADFLNHAGRLSQAMIDVSRQGQLQLLSVHCHALIPMGVTCVGVMLKSHITFHTWPEEGVILLDLMTFQRDEAIDQVVKSLEHFFGVPSADRPRLPQSKWALKRRGFQDAAMAEQSRFERNVLGSMEFEHKHQVVATETPHFKVEIYDTIGYPRRWADYERSLDASTGSYESQNAHLYQPDRILLLNQVVQSRRLGEARFNEVLVHPAMLLQSHPRHVAIIGGGTGSALREALKHSSVESVVAVELDEAIVRLSKEHLPEWSDCQPLVGMAASCFDDPRVNIEYANGVDWFLNRKRNNEFDVVIVDV